jgi:hypothetical protein
MRKKISVIGKGVKIAPDLSRIAHVVEDVHGADVVVLAEETDLAVVARSAPAAALVVTGDDVENRCRRSFEHTLFPRARIVGVADPSELEAVLESIVLERDDQHEVIAMSDGRFGPRSARIGRGGIRELL